MQPREQAQLDSSTTPILVIFKNINLINKKKKVNMPLEKLKKLMSNIINVRFLPLGYQRMNKALTLLTSTST